MRDDRLVPARTIVVVGGGVIGCAVAERLTRERQYRVILCERDSVGAHASGAAAGLLSPGTEAGARAGDLATRSFEMMPELVERVERSGVHVEYRSGESVTPALSSEEERTLRAEPGRWLDQEQARREEPGLSRSVLGAAVRPASQVTPRRLVMALARTAVAQGAEVREGWPVGQLLTRSGQVRGVQGHDGTLAADAVVLAAGPWSPSLASPAGLALDVRPSRGQLVLLHPRPGVLLRMLTWRRCYLVPKPDGSIVAGSTEEDAGFHAHPTAAGISMLLEFAGRAVPALADAPVGRTWAALRPAASEPIVGPAPGLANLWLATGHDRVGILLAAATAEAVARQLEKVYDR
jgi:glycine oxidase